MNSELEALIEKARKIQMNAEDRAEQRKSFAYGNAGFENPRITRAMVDEQFGKIERGE